MAFGSTSSRSHTKSAARCLIPSIADLIFVALLALLTFTSLSVRLLGDGGIGWHIRTGQLILSTHSIPHADPFSSTMAGQPWFAWEWLYDVIVGWLDRLAGLNAVVFLTAVVIALTFSWTFRLLLERGASLVAALPLTLLAASAAMIHFFARPHIFSWLFTVSAFWILESSERPANAPAHKQKARLLWLLPPLMLLWANIHGGFLLGFALIGIYFLSACWLWLSTRENRFDDVLKRIRAGQRSRDLGLAGLAAALATLLNPYGWNLHVHIYRYLSNRFLMDHIDEFQSPNFHGVAQKCFAILLLLAAIALALRGAAGNARLRGGLLALFAVYSGLYASRNIPVSALLLVLLAGPPLSNAVAALRNRFPARRSSPSPGAIPGFFHRMQAIDASLRGHAWPFVALLVTAWITFHGGVLASHQVMHAHFDPARFPVAAITYLESQGMPPAILAPDSWGGFLIYRLHPRTKVEVDDRHDFYGEDFLKAYLTTMHVEPGWEDFLNQQRTRCVIVPRNSALASILRETRGWRPAFSDDVATVFFREPAVGP